MKLKIINIANKGDFKKEHVWIRVVEDCNLGNFIVADSTYIEKGKVSDKLKHMFWMPDTDVKKGDFVAIRTGVGINETYVDSKNRTVHRLYWDLKTSVWNDDEDCAILFEIKKWVPFQVR